MSLVVILVIAGLQPCDARLAQSPANGVLRALATLNASDSLDGLLARFKAEPMFWQQFEIGKAIADRRDASVLPALEGWLTHEDRHIRGNVAYIFGRLGDPRGLATIAAITSDRSYRPEGQGVAIASSDFRYHVERQIRSDRYYAAHLLGDLGDKRGVEILVPLLNDRDVQTIVAWSLGQIGDRRAIPPLIDALGDPSPAMRVFTIHALETFRAKEVVPHLTRLLGDDQRSNLGDPISVADAAKAAIGRLQAVP